MELYIDTLGGLDLDGSTDKNLPYFVVENLATLILTPQAAHIAYAVSMYGPVDTAWMTET